MRVVLFVVLISSTFAINLEEVLSKTDDFLQVPRSDDEVASFEKLMVNELTARNKRSITEDYVQEKVRVFEGTSTVTYSSYSSPSDLNGFELDGKIYAVSIQYSMPDGDKSENPLLVLYKIEESTSRFLDLDPLESDGIVEVHNARNNVLIAVTQRGKKHEGCVIYRIVKETLARTQLLDTPIPLNLKLASNLQKDYMAISTPDKIQIFEWKGRHFDLSQELNLKACSAFNFFIIDNILFLATSADKEVNENLACGVWEQNLETHVFECHQYLEQKPATSMNYFRLKGESPGEEEHFLVVGYKSGYSVIYKQESQIFQPFQRIVSDHAVQWLPFEDSESFVLFQLTDKVTPFAYNGWRFVKRNVPVTENTLRHGCSKLRKLQKSNESWLIAVNSGIEMAAMMRLSFEPQPSMQERTAALTEWCQKQMTLEDAVDKLNLRLVEMPSSDDNLVFHQNVTFQQLKVDTIQAKTFRGFTADLIFEINEAAAIVKEVEQILDDMESLSQASFFSTKVQGPLRMKNLVLNCDESTPCVIPTLYTGLINEIPAQDFVDNIVNLSDGIQSNGHFNFEILRATNSNSIYFNNNIGSSLVSRKSDVNLGDNLRVNGSVIFHGNVFVSGEIHGVVIDREHVVLHDEDQFLAGKLMLNTATVKDMALKKSINGAQLNNLWSDRDPNNHGPWDILTVENMTINGRIAGHPVWKFFNQANISADDVIIEDGKISGVNITDLVRIDQGDYSLKSDISLLQPMTVENLHVTESINQIPLIIFTQLTSPTDSDQTEPIKLRNFVADEIIIKGSAKIPDIILGNSNSLNQLIAENNNDLKRSMQENDDTIVCDANENFDKNGSIEICVNFNCYTRKLENNLLVVDELITKSLNITGKINNFNWSDFVNDAVFKGDNVTVYGRKSVEGILEVTDLVIDGLINNQTFDEFFNSPTNFELSDVLTVENLNLNGVPLLSDQYQNESFPFSNVHFEGGVNAAFINEMDIGRFYKDVAFINESTQLGAVNFLDRVFVENLTNYDSLNGANFYKSILLRNSTERQVIDGHWIFQNVQIEGELIVHGETNGMDLTVLCEMSQNDPKIIVDGSVETIYEPKVSKMVNDILMDELLDDLWLKTEPTVLQEDVKFSNILMEGNVTLRGNLNGIKLDNLARGYLSKSKPRRMIAPIYIKNLTSLGMVRAPNITGMVNNVNLGKFAASVLQYGIDQTFTGRPHFFKLSVPKLDENCTINEFNLRTDVLRYSTEAYVTGLKSIGEVVAKKFTISAGKTLQGVDFDAWTKEAVLKDATLIYGNFTFKSTKIEDVLSVTGTVGGIKFDEQHLFTVNGNQTITGQKVFTGDLFMESLALNGLLNEIDMNDILKNSAYSDKDVVLSSPIQLQNIRAKHLKLSGKLSGVNVTDFCLSGKNRLAIDNLDSDYEKLLTVASHVYDNFANAAYYLDHYEIVQKFDRNVTAVASLPDSSGSAIAVFRRHGFIHSVTIMVRDNRDNVFKTKKDFVDSALSGNTSLVTSGRSHILVETWKQGGVLYYKNYQIPLNISQSTCAVPFELAGSKICIFVGQKNLPDSLMCGGIDEQILQVVQNFEASHCIQAASVNTTNTTWLAVIGAKASRPATETFVTVFSKSDKENAFQPRQDLPVLHPVSVTATTHELSSYLVVASQHHPGSVRSSLLAIFRYAALSDKWIRYQEIVVEAPRFVSLEHLPTGQLALYVLTDNPARAFLVYLYRGVEGFVEETAGLAVHPGKFLSVFNSGNDHFVGIAGDRFSQLLQAHFLGRRFG